MASFSPMAFLGRALSSLFLAGVLLFPNRASVAQELTLEQLIDRNVQALGGRAAIEALQSIKLALHIVDPNFEVDAIYHAARPGLMRIEITAGGKVVYAEAFNGTDLKTGKVLEKVTVREITLNPPAPEGFFDTFEH